MVIVWRPNCLNASMQSDSQYVEMTYKAFCTLFILICPMGWIFSHSAFQDQALKYALLCTINTILVLLLLILIDKHRASFIDIWASFVIFCIGLYVKFYVLILFSRYDLFDKYLSNRFPNELIYLNDTKSLIDYYTFITVVMVFFVIYVTLLANSKLRNPWKAIELPVRQSTATNSAAPVVVLILALLVGAAILTVNYVFNVGTPYSAHTPPLPFRLAGFITAINQWLLPILFLWVIYKADSQSNQNLLAWAVLLYMLFGVLNGLVSTSKSWPLQIWTTVFLVALFTQRLNFRRLIALLSLLPPIMLVVHVVILLRKSALISRPANVDPLTTMPIDTMPIDVHANTPLIDLVTNATDILLRFGGADSLFHILNFESDLSMERALGMLLGVPKNISELFNYDVLGYSEPLFGTAFSPSLLGALYLVFPHTVFACIAFVFFLFFWRVIFLIVANSKMETTAAALAQLTILFALYVSEGTLDSLVQKLLTFAVALIGAELLIRTINHIARSIPLGDKS